MSIWKGKVSFGGTRLGIFIMVVSLCGALAPSANALTLATFSDPADDGATPLFTLMGDPLIAGSTLSGGWSNLGLDLIVPWTGDTYPDATFTMTDLTVTAPFMISSGQIDFFDSLNNPILSIEFDSAMLYSPFGFGASELAGHNVSFSSPVIAFPPLTEQTFSFSFANQVTFSEDDKTTWTAAFTSSAVPEPGTLALLVFGALAMARRPRMN